MNVPSNLRYSENDEWIKVEGPEGVIGISDHAQEQLSDIVFVEVIASAGDTVKKGDTIATVESVKAAADVYAPVGGKVVEINESLGDTPEMINSDPYGGAWMIKIELTNPAELEKLMDSGAYESHVASKAG